jgi:hypothetical protein
MNPSLASMPNAAINNGLKKTSISNVGCHDGNKALMINSSLEQIFLHKYLDEN